MKMLKFNSLLLVFLISSITRASLKDSLVARFSFNETKTSDDAGKFIPKFYGVKLVEDRFGNPFSAYYFQGNYDSYINLGTSSLLKPTRGSISLWVKIDQQMFKGEGLHCNPIIRTRSREEDDFNEGYALMYHFHLRKVNTNTSYTEMHQVTVYPSTTSYLQQWYHLVMTYDDAHLKLYVDGELEGSSAKDFESKFLEGDSILVGMIHGPNNKRYLQGTVDDICIYNKVLSPSEVKTLYEEPDPNRNAIILKWIFYSALILLTIVLIILVIKWRVKRVLQEEKEKNQLKNNWYEQENKVLSAQMDPHFIFNSLNTIQQFIISNDNDKAQIYLSKFSRLMRRLLESNTADNITLKEEIEIFKMYLEIESLRFNNVFTYTISVDSSIDENETRIPHFLIQPLIENAIWHGLLPKDGDKLLDISFKKVNDQILSCTITDNGVGRLVSSLKLASPIISKKSLAINFIEQRLALLSKLEKIKCEIKIIDRLDENNQSEGTTVIITIPILKNKEDATSANY